MCEREACEVLCRAMVCDKRRRGWSGPRESAWGCGETVRTWCSEGKACVRGCRSADGRDGSEAYEERKFFSKLLSVNLFKAASIFNTLMGSGSSILSPRSGGSEAAPSVEENIEMAQ